MIFDRTTREQALADIRGALRDERQDETRAEMLAGIADDFDVPIEYVVQWLHLQPAGRTFKMVQFSAFAKEFGRFKRETAARFQEFIARNEEAHQ